MGLIFGLRWTRGARRDVCGLQMLHTGSLRAAPDTIGDYGTRVGTFLEQADLTWGAACSEKLPCLTCRPGNRRGTRVELPWGRFGEQLKLLRRPLHLR